MKTILSFLLTPVVLVVTIAGETVLPVRLAVTAASAVLVGLWIRGLLAGRADVVDRWVLVSLLFFLAACLLSQFPRQSFDAATTALAYTALFYVARRQLGRIEIRTPAIRSVALVGTGLAVGFAFAWLAWWFQWLQLAGWSRLPPLGLDLPALYIADRHYVPLLLAMLLPAALLSYGQRSAMPWLGVGAALLVTVIGGSRNVWLAALLATVIVVGPTMQRSIARQVSRRVLAAAVVAGLVGLALVLLGPAGSVTERLFALSTLAARAELWQASLTAWLTDPLTGLGPGSFPFALQLTDYFARSTFVPRHPDNALMQLLPEAGLLGLLAVAALGVAMVTTVRGWPMHRHALWALAFFVSATIGANPSDYAFLIVPAIGWAAIASPAAFGETAVAPTAGRPHVVVGVGVAAGMIALAVALTSIGRLAHAVAREEAASGRHDAAMRSLDLAIAVDPAMAIYWRDRGVLRLEGEDATSARVDLERAVAVNPVDSAAWRALAASASADGDHASSVPAAQRAVRLQASDFTNLIALADAAMGAGDPETTTGALVDALRQAPWASGDPRLDALMTGEVALDELVALAQEASLRDGLASYGAREPFLSFLNGGRDFEAALRQTPAHLRTAVAPLALLAACDLDAAQASVERAFGASGGDRTYWLIRIMVHTFAGQIDGRDLALAALAWPDLGAALSPNLEPGGYFGGGQIDRWGYEAVTIHDAWPSDIPSAVTGLRAWATDPLTTMQLTGLGPSSCDEGDALEGAP